MSKDFGCSDCVFAHIVETNRGKLYRICANEDSNYFLDEVSMWVSCPLLMDDKELEVD